MEPVLNWVIKKEPKRWKRILLAPIRWFCALLLALGVVTTTAAVGTVMVPVMVLKTALMIPG
jgi:hypothetical protein